MFHTSLELISVFICFWVSGMAFMQYRVVPSMLSFFFFTAFGLVGIFDIFHAILPLINEELIPYWIPITWNSTRLSLLILLTLGVIFASKKDLWFKWYLVLSVFIFNALVFIFGSGFHSVYVTGFITRPFDFTLLILWALLWACILISPFARMQLPKHVHAFMGLGCLSHAIMAFGSQQAMDMLFLGAHITKNLEYLTWAIMEQVSLYSLITLGARATFSGNARKRDIEKLLKKLEVLT